MLRWSVLLWILLLLLMYETHAQCTVDVSTNAATRDRRDDKTRLKVVSYNAEWLFLGDNAKCRTAGWNRFDRARRELRLPAVWTVPNIQRKSVTDVKALATEHLDRIGSYLAKLDADIIVLEEVCDCNTLRAVIEVMERVDGALRNKYHAYLDYYDSDLKQQIGIITQIDPSPKNSGIDDAADIVYNAGNIHGFEAKFKLGRKTLVLYGLHFPSGDSYASLRSRRRAAKRVKDRITDQLTNGELFIITGDLNTDGAFISSRVKPWSPNRDAARTLVRNFAGNRNQFETQGKIMTLDSTGATYKVTVNARNLGQISPAGKNDNYGVVIATEICGIHAEFDDNTPEINERNGVNNEPLLKARVNAVMTQLENKRGNLNVLRIDFRERRRENSFTEFAAYRHITSLQGADQKYSHQKCGGTEEQTVMDHFFMSANWPVTPNMIYEHKTYRPVGYLTYRERICKLVSDHCPIFMEIDLTSAHNDYKTYAAHSLYSSNNYLKYKHRKLPDQDEEKHWIRAREYIPEHEPSRSKSDYSGFTDFDFKNDDNYQREYGEDIMFYVLIGLIGIIAMIMTCCCLIWIVMTIYCVLCDVFSPNNKSNPCLMRQYDDEQCV